MGRRSVAYTHDVVVIGAGAAGLTAAGGCALWGLRVALVERAAMGGECLNAGCVPSKALLAAAAAAQGVRRAARFGVATDESVVDWPVVDWAGVRAHVARAIATIAPHDSAERFEAMGVEVIAGEARFTGPDVLEVDGRRLRAPRIVLATGSRPHVPDLPGLDGGAYLTSETVWNLDRRPEHLLILGGGGVAAEMAQAFRRLGARVTVVARGRLLPREDAGAARIVADRLRAEGVILLEGLEAFGVEQVEGGVTLHLSKGEPVAGSHLLIATGREVDLTVLDASAAGIEWDASGARADARRRTSNRRVYAIGDCRAGPRFTHLSGHDGTVAALNIALGWPARVERRAVPRATYTDPELAQLGLTEEEARDRHGVVQVEVAPFAEDDRAVCESDAAGFVKTIWTGRRLIGVTIVGRGAGDLLLPWTLVMKGKASRFAMADSIVAYPTRSERSREAAFRTLSPLLFSKPVRRWAKLLAMLRRRT